LKEGVKNNRGEEKWKKNVKVRVRRLGNGHNRELLHGREGKGA